MICKQLCPSHYMKTGVMSPCPQATDPKFKLSQVPAFSCSEVGITLHGGLITSHLSQTSGGFSDI